MKTFTCILLSIFMLFTLSVSADGDDKFQVFEVDIENIESEFKLLDEAIESGQIEKETDLVDLGILSPQGIATDPDNPDNRLWGIPSIVYGLVLGPFGVAAVGIGTKDWKEVGKAAIGMGITIAVFGTIVIIQAANDASNQCSDSISDSCSNSCSSSVSSGCNSGLVPSGL